MRKFELDDHKSIFDKSPDEKPYMPSTFAGRMVQATGAPRYISDIGDIVSSVAGIFSPYPSAADLGYDLDNLVHGDTEWYNPVLDAAAMIPLVPKFNLDKKGGKNWVDAAKFVYNQAMQRTKAVPTINKTIRTARVVDTVQDTAPAAIDLVNGRNFKKPAIRGSVPTKQNQDVIKAFNKKFGLTTTPMPPANFMYRLKR